MRPTRKLKAIIRGLRRGGQSGLADMIEVEIEALQPLLRDVQLTRKQYEHEERRQAEVTDDIVTNLIKAQIYEREELQRMMKEFGIKQVETIIRSSSVGGRADVDILTDERRIIALRTFLEKWNEEIGPLRNGEAL